MAQEKEGLKGRIAQVLAENRVMNLASEGEASPWWVTAFFVEEWLRKEEMGPLNRPKAWLLATRPWSFPASIVPMLVGGALAHRAGEFGGGLFVLTLLGGLLFHIGANLFNTYFDFRPGVDSSADADDRTLVDGILRPRDVAIGGAAAFAVGAGIGGFLVSQAGLVILALGGIGLALGLFYTADPLGYKYRGLGDLGIFAAFGPVLVLGAYMVQTEKLDLLPFLFAVPLGLIIDAILHANNLRDVQADRRSGAVTMAQLLGEDGSRWAYAALVLAPYV